MKKNFNFITVAICILILVCVFFSLPKVQNSTFAGENDTALFLDNATKKETSGKLNLYTKIISTLLVLIALIIATVFVLRKNYGFKANIGRGKRHLQILEHLTLGVKKSIFLVKIPGKHLLLGVTNEKIGLITEVENEDVDFTVDTVNKSDFINLIKKSYFEKKKT